MLSFRKARQGDSTDLTLCMDVAARGLSAWGWSNFSNKGQSAFEFGRERIRTDESSKLYFKNWVVCELNNSLLGAFLGFRVDDPYPAIDFDNFPKYFHPIIELERCASGSWLLQAISILPEFRGKGYAIHILREVEADAKQSGVKQIALQVESENEVAFGFYQRNGYREIERRPSIPFPGSKDSGDYILMCKELT
jgi:ribosomal protein S18 acetylase RimI-like enzyme